MDAVLGRKTLGRTMLVVCPYMLLTAIAHQTEWVPCQNAGFRYHVTPTHVNKTWDEAVEHCKEQNATLADPQNSMENTCVRNLTDCTSDESFWLGVKRFNSSIDTFYSNRTGKEAHGTEWHCDEPKEKLCVQFKRNITGQNATKCKPDECTYLWDDTFCSHKIRFFCQADIDECADGVHNCHVNGSDCHNTYGSFECRCRTAAENISLLEFYTCQASYQDPNDFTSLQSALENNTLSTDELLSELGKVTRVPTRSYPVVKLVAEVTSVLLNQLPPHGTQSLTFTTLLSYLHNFTAEALLNNFAINASGGIFSMASWTLNTPPQFESSAESTTIVRVFHNPHLSVGNGGHPVSAIRVLSSSFSIPTALSRSGRKNAAALIFGNTNLFQTKQQKQFAFPEDCHDLGDADYFLNTLAVYSIQLGASANSSVYTELDFEALCAAQEAYCAKFENGKWSSPRDGACESIGNTRSVSTGQVVSCHCNSSGIYGLFASPIDDSQSLRDLKEAERALDGSDVTGVVITKATKAIEGVVSRPSTSPEVGEALTAVVDLIMRSPPSSLRDSQAENNGTSRLLKSIDKYFSRVLLKPAEVRSTNSSKLLTRVEAVDTGVPFETTTYQITNESISEGSHSQPSVEVTLPDNITSHMHVRLRRGQAYVPVQISSFASSAVFLDGSQDVGGNTTVGSAVLSVHVGNSSLQLDNRVVIRFALNEAGTNPVCSFWDFNKNNGRGGWSSRGCETISNKTVKVSDVVSCRCNHLTHFGILLSTSPTARTSLEVLTLIGTIFSFVCLFVLLLTVLRFRKFWREIRTKILLQLVTSLAVSGLLFVVMAHMDVRNNTNACLALAVLLHYFPLAMFFWTLIEALYLYRLLVAVYSKEVNHLFAKCCVFAWGLPAVIVFVTVAADKFTLNNYDPRGKNPSSFCRIKDIYFWVALVAPICTVIALNTLLFLRICREILRKRPSSSKHMLSDRPKQFLMTISIAFLLGLSWLAGLSALDSSSPVFFQYVFGVLQMLTSFFLLLFHVVLRKEIRQEWVSSFSSYQSLKFSRSTQKTSVRMTSTSIKGSRRLASLGSSFSSSKTGEKFAVNATNTSSTELQLQSVHTSPDKTLPDQGDRSGSDSGIST